MKVVASFVGGWGHAGPLLESALLARGWGHDVTFIGQSFVLPQLARYGFQTVALGPDTITDKRLSLRTVDREFESAAMRNSFVRRFGRARATALASLFKEFNTELLLCDEVDFGALVAAERMGIPSVTVNVIAAGRLVSQIVVGEAWNELRVEHGLDPDSDGARLGGGLCVAPFPASFRDPTVPVTPRWQPVRPVTPAHGPVRDRPLVYATLGTVFNVESGDLLGRIVDGLRIVGADALVTTGPFVDVDEFHGVPERVRIAHYVDQRLVLGQCAAVVCHGGSGTLMAALAAGVPVVVLPLGADHPDNADRCLDLGCGVVLDAAAATPADIAAAVSTVTGEPEFRLAAQRLADEAARQTPLSELGDFTRQFSA